jgi:uncharacterized protein (TIGR02444 family)
MTKQSRSELEAESWAFALEFYAQPGVSDACLTLQNKAGVDVMLLLMVTFAAAKRRRLLTYEETKALNDACRPWRDQIVRPLRRIRLGLKEGPSPAPSEETERFRSNIKAVELAAERLQNQLLAESLPLAPPEKEPINRERLHAALVEIVGLYAEQRAEALHDSLSSSIDTIVAAAIRHAS